MKNKNFRKEKKKNSTTKKGKQSRKRPATPGNHGRDISNNYCDTLDRACVEHVRTILVRKKIKTLDLGCGLGDVSLQMAELGAKVTMFDISNMPKDNIIRAISEKRVAADKVVFRQKSFANILVDEVPNNLDVLYSQRALHYLKYEELKNSLSTIFNKMAKGGKAFLSVGCCDGPLAKDYPALDRGIKDRFSCLSLKMAGKNKIHQPVTLYSKGEFKELLQSVGFTNIDIMNKDKVSIFNIKVSAVKNS